MKKHRQHVLTPVFIGGHARSGTSFFSALFDGHPELLVLPHETGFFSNYIRFRRERDPYQLLMRIVGQAWDGHRKTSVEHLDVRSNWRPYPYYSCITEAYPQAEQELLPYVKGRRVRGLFEKLVAMTSDCLWKEGGRPGAFIEKTPGNEYFFPWLYRHMPEARLLYIVRNPSHVVHSVMKKRLNHKPGLPIRSIFDVIYSWKLSWSACALCKRRFPNRVHIVKYETLVTKTMVEMQKVCGFLNIAFDPCLLKSSLFGRAKGPESHESTITGPLDGSPNPTFMKKNLEDTLSASQLEAIDYYTRRERSLLQYGHGSKRPVRKLTGQHAPLRYTIQSWNDPVRWYALTFSPRIIARMIMFRNGMLLGA